MKLKNIKNSVIVLNSVWICKGTDNGLDYNSKNTKFTVDKIFEYISEKITDTTDKIIKNVDIFKKKCKDNRNFIIELINENLQEIKKIDKKIKTTGIINKEGSLNGYFVEYSLKYTVNNLIKKYLYNLVTNSLNVRDELINKLKDLNDKYTTDELNNQINELKKEEKYKYIVNLKEIQEIIKNIKPKIDKPKPKPKSKDETKPDDVNNKEEEEKKKKEEKIKKQIEEKNKDLNKKLNDLIKTNKYDSIKSAELETNLNNIKKNIFIDGFDENKVNENNKKLISQIESDIQTKKTKEIEEENKNKTTEELKNDLNKKLNDIITNSTNKKSSEIENDLNSILNVSSYKEFLKGEEINKLVEKIKEIINNKKEEEKTKKPEKDEEEEEDDDDNNKNKDDDNKNKDLPSNPTPVEDKKGYCGKNKKADSASNKKGYSGKN